MDRQVRLAICGAGWAVTTLIAALASLKIPLRTLETTVRSVRVAKQAALLPWGRLAEL